MVSSPSEKSVFLHALGLVTPEERRAYLDEVCRGRPDMRAGVEALFAAHARLEAPPHRPDDTATADPSAGADGTTVVYPATAPEAGTVVAGRYKLLQRAGEGGMGEVWMAEQTEPVHRQVAVKLIKTGMDSRQVVGRFEAERQALALMDHPNIATVFDAGTTDDGRPFFVMELVKGVPITRYCDDRRLTPRDRLELFLQVCAAVQHAHQKGVIHRDLKPSNVLVAEHDGRPVVKVIDFGIAKAAGRSLTDEALFTGLGLVVGTPEYMSPEQAELNNADIDTRSDVYSLGVLLYELLVGSPPFTRKDVEVGGVLEMLRVVREREPVRPSTRLSTTGGLPALAEKRGTDPRRLAALVRGELDWIVMKAVEKDRGRRYETASSLALDVRRYLADEPVTACPPSVVYRVRKFARRNRGPVLAAGVAMLLLLGGTVGTTIGLVQADRARRAEADQRRDAERERDEKETARAEAVAHLQTARRSIARLSQIAGDYAAFEPRTERVWRDLLRDTTEFYQELLRTRGDDPVIRQETGVAYGRLGVAHLRLGEKDQGFATLGQAVEILEGLWAKGPLTREGRVALIRAYQELGWLHGDFRRQDDLVSTHRQSLAHAERLAADFPDTPSRNLLGDACTTLGFDLLGTRPDEARALFRRAIEVLDTPDGNRYHLGRALVGLAELSEKEHRYHEAETGLLQAIERFQELHKKFSHMWQHRDRLGKAYQRHARVLVITGRPDEAAQALRRAVSLFEDRLKDYREVPRYPEELITAYAELVRVLAATGRVEEAGAVFAKLSPLAPESAAACNSLAWLLATCPGPSFRDPDRAVELARKAVGLAPLLGRHSRTLGVALYRAGEWKEAVDYLKTSAVVREADAHDWFFLAMALWKHGEAEKARGWYAKAVRWTDENQPNNDDLRRFRAEAEELLGPAGGLKQSQPK